MFNGMSFRPEEWVELKRKIYVTCRILNEVVDFLIKENPEARRHVEFDSNVSCSSLKLEAGLF
jgi:hypothetical protein